MKVVHWPLHLVQRGGTRWGHPSAASVPISCRMTRVMIVSVRTTEWSATVATWFEIKPAAG